VDCPRCHKEIADAAVECPYCHIVVAQYLKRRRELASGVVTPGAPVEEEKKGSSIWLFVVMLAMFAAYLVQHSNRHKPRPRPAVAVAPAEPTAPETPQDDETPPQESSVTVESNDSNASAESFKKGDQKIKKLVQATAPLRIGNPEKVLEDK
jgi:hypothetical protein